MSKWTKSLPAPMENDTNRCANILYLVGLAMMENRSLSIRILDARRAAAEIRAWRKSLGVRSVKEVTLYSDDNLQYEFNRVAGHIINADNQASSNLAKAWHLRWAEAHIREVVSKLEKVKG